MKIARIIYSIVAVILVTVMLLHTMPFATILSANAATITESYYKKSEMSQQEWQLLLDTMDEYTSFVITKQKQLGGSHYAYTEAVSDTYNADSPNVEETTMFNPGSQLVLVELEKSGDEVKKTETVLLDSPSGVIRDPDVSLDGTKVLFSWKQNKTEDDYHIYEYDLITNEYIQLTFGLGAADTEPRYLPDGRILFSSTRCIQSVDCYKVPVSNLYVCESNGENIIRLGYDQVHTTYPTLTSDGRVIYTRWDYNDRTQMYVQGVYQMFPDGTNQTELYGNNSNFPTSLIHTREIPGTTDKYISIASGHHNVQIGKLVILDTSKGRNTDDAITFILPDEGCTYDDNRDAEITQVGAQYKYPYPLNENQFIVSYSAEGYNNKVSTVFDICIMDTSGTMVELVSGTSALPACQLVPITKRTLFERPSMVNYSSDTGNFYIGDIYSGDGLKGIARGEAKYLRVVELEFREYSIGDTRNSGAGSSQSYSPIATGNGSWDVKKVLGIVPIEEDGSVLFKAPAETPLYFQVLDKDGSMIQSMRSWTTLMPGETFSCVGCHEDKNTVPPASATPTMAMSKGVQEIQPDFWQTGEGYENYDPYGETKGFSYLEEIQPILDENCVQCHNDLEAAYSLTNAYSMGGSDTTIPEDEETTNEVEISVFGTGEQWKYIKGASLNTVPTGWNTVEFDDSSWSTGTAPFGDRSANGVKYATSWTGDDKYIWIRKTFNVDNLAELKTAIVKLKTFYDDNPEFYINGHKFYEPDDWVDAYTEVKLSSSQSLDMTSYLKEGENVLAVRCENDTGGRMIDTSLTFVTNGNKTMELFPVASSGWQYLIDEKPSDTWVNTDFDASSWNTGKGIFGCTKASSTQWGAVNTQTEIRIRKEFTLSASDISYLENMNLVLSILYDQDPIIYLNGTKISEISGYYDKEYAVKNIDLKYTNLLKEGKNVLAIYARNVTNEGGCCIDAGLSAIEFEGKAFSLQGKLMGSTRMGKEMPISYLVLTNSKAESGPGDNAYWKGWPTNYANWITNMSQCEMLNPYQFGSAKSGIVRVLTENHNGVTLTDVEMRKIRAWMDLSVPCFGSYDEGNIWNANGQRWANEYHNKRVYYDKMNELACNARIAGENAKASEVEISYKSGSVYYNDWYNFSGASKLEVPQLYKSGDIITVTMPEGQHYLGLTLDLLMGESIIYVPNGVYTFTVPANLSPYNRTFNNYTSHTITARAVGEDELSERRNLALNPYDLTDTSGNMTVTGYPHATTDSNYSNSSQFIVRNAIDGMTANKGHGSYPVQSWGPDQGTGHWMQVNFGREVTVDEVVITIRADFPHDTYFESATLEFSDGTTVDIKIEKTDKEQSFTFDAVNTSYVKLTNLKAVDISGDDWAAITEFEVYGTEVK